MTPDLRETLPGNAGKRRKRLAVIWETGVFLRRETPVSITTSMRIVA